MKNVPDGERGARFVCFVAVRHPDGREESFQGELRGEISREPRGGGGFGYDPVFFLRELGLTVAQLTPARKNEISHRSAAFRKLRDSLLRDR